MIRVPWVFAVAAAACACTGGSRQRGYEYMPDMARGVSYKSFAPNPVTRDGKTLQRPAVGTIPRGYQPFHYGATPEEAERAGRELSSPVPESDETLAEGNALYETFCLVCHGVAGQGDGPLVPKIPNPPSYGSRRIQEMRPGQIFHVITVGSGRMPSYASQISAGERWKIVHYVGSLVRASRGPEEQR